MTYTIVEPQEREPAWVNSYDAQAEYRELEAIKDAKLTLEDFGNTYLRAQHGFLDAVTAAEACAASPVAEVIKAKLSESLECLAIELRESDEYCEASMVLADVEKPESIPLTGAWLMRFQQPWQE